MENTMTTGAGTAPKVTIEQIEAEIASEHYFTAMGGVIASLPKGRTDDDLNAVPECLNRTLFCVLVLKNGMRVEGVNHGSVSAANQYPREKCEQLAREAAIEKLWPMFGFELAQKLYRESQGS